MRSIVGSRNSPQDSPREGRAALADAARLACCTKQVVSKGSTVSPPNDEGHRANGAPQVQAKDQHSHFANDDDAGKAFAAMQARAALCGCTLHELAGGTYLVGRWNCSKSVPCLRAVGYLLRQIGGRQ
jgi:hypothetical protein